MEIKNRENAPCLFESFNASTSIPPLHLTNICKNCLQLFRSNLDKIFKFFKICSEKEAVEKFDTLLVGNSNFQVLKLVKYGHTKLIALKNIEMDRIIK